MKCLLSIEFTGFYNYKPVF